MDIEATLSETLLPETMTHAEAVARARALAPAVRERAADAERARRQPRETVAEIVSAGLVRLLVPRRWGGYELSFDALADTVIEIAKCDASAGWNYSFLVVHPWFLALFPEEAQLDVWSESPDVLLATSFNPAGRYRLVEGGYRVSGNWPWSSGVDHCSWAILSALPETMDGPPRSLLIPRHDYSIQDTWFVAGQRATGSNNVVVEDVFVPAHRAVMAPALARGQAPGVAVNTGPLYRYPLLTAFPCALVAPLLGAALGAYEIWHEGLKTKYTGLSGERVSLFSHLQIRLAEIAASLDSAHLLLRRALETLRTDVPLDAAICARQRRDYCYVARLCTQAVEQIYLNSGGGANYEKHPLQRYWRDVHAIAAHAALNFDAAGEYFGRTALGLPPSPHDYFAL